MKTVIVAGAVACLALVGCKKAEVTEAAPVKAAPVKVSVDASADAAPPPPPPAASTEVATTDGGGEPIPAGEHEATLNQMTEALHVYLQIAPDYPKDLKELVEKNLIKKLPTPPPGQRFAIDKKAIRVVLVAN